MENFIEYVLRFGRLTPDHIQLLRERGAESQLKKDDHYWEPGKAVNQIGFLTEGVLRVFYYNQAGDEITRYFIEENHLILDGETEDEVYIASEYLSAATDCNLVVFKSTDWKFLSEHIPCWNSIVQQISAAHHREKIERRSELVSMTATERYLDFIQKFPTLVNRIPLAYVASYLGITQSSLSRIRKSVR